MRSGRSNWLSVFDVHEHSFSAIRLQIGPRLNRASRSLRDRASHAARQFQPGGGTSSQ